MLKKGVIAISAFVFLVSGCASLMSGTSQSVTVDSEPQGAKVIVGKVKVKDGVSEMVDGKEVGVTPIDVQVSRRKGMVQVSKEGYKTVDVPLKTRMNPWVWGDILLTSPLSTSIDTTTGASSEYSPGKYMVTLPQKQ